MQNVRWKLVFECAPSDPDSQKQEVDGQETETGKRFGGLFSLPDSQWTLKTLAPSSLAPSLAVRF